MIEEAKMVFRECIFSKTNIMEWRRIVCTYHVHLLTWILSADLQELLFREKDPANHTQSHCITLNRKYKV